MSLVTITGGAGNLGREVARVLAARQHRVRVFDVPDVDYSFAANQENLEIVQGDLREPESVAEAVCDADWIVHLAAIMPPLSEMNHDLTRAVNVEGTRALLNTLPRDAKLVFASSVATYGVAQMDVVDINHPQQPIDFYGKTKLQNERDISASDRRAAILRISGISVPALLEIPRPWFFAREQKVEFVHLRDAARAVANCVGNENALGRVWQIAGGASWRKNGEDYSNAICDAFDIPREYATFPDEANWPAWFDTTESEAALNYQQHTFEEFVGELKEIYREAVLA